MLKIFDVLISLLMLINSFIYKLKVRVESSRFFYFFKPLDTDIYIASYMKSGTTLTQVMLFEILNKKNLDYSNINDVSPFLDTLIRRRNGFKILNRKEAPRLIKTHLHYNFLKTKIKGKVIYVQRDGMDVAWSQYHHIKSVYQPELTWKQHSQQFLDDSRSDSWFKHVKQWRTNKNKINITYLQYEDVVTDLGAAAEKLADFIGVELTEEQKAQVVERCRFDRMKKEEKKYSPKPNFSNFIREGRTGSGKQNFSDEQQQLFLHLSNKHFKNC
ncbi:sulfotransferase domain-containing protein [Pseudoalteromonas sp. MMG006]|uniref:sulfotransferase domain-containing protein n=1 Tax=Pseudoalteromonas sp. MMG006 TaxID=2822683 RepID=UPI001B3702F9|nr:sulfotransferase domain-containing protein [Pseudoalteromonas sp. MMG006]MBQ4800944.1 sulfotransferase domain-containing protein [Pseudoalteromonas sp. MMG006]